MNIAAKICVLRVTLEEVGLEDGGFDKIPIRPSFPNSVKTLCKSSYTNPLPAIFLAICFFIGPGLKSLPLSDCNSMWRWSRYFMVSAACVVVTIEQFSTIDFSGRSRGEENIFLSAIASSRASCVHQRTRETNTCRGKIGLASEMCHLIASETRFHF